MARDGTDGGAVLRMMVTLYQERYPILTAKLLQMPAGRTRVTRLFTLAAVGADYEDFNRVRGGAPVSNLQVDKLEPTHSDDAHLTLRELREDLGWTTE